MNEKARIKDWQRMYDEVTDPELVEKNKRKVQRQERIRERIIDTGLEYKE